MSDRMSATEYRILEAVVAAAERAGRLVRLAPRTVRRLVRQARKGGA